MWISCRLFDEKTQSIYNNFLADPLSEDELIDHIRILQQKVTTAKQDGRCNGSKKYKGGPAADKLLPPGSFLRLPSMDEKGLKYIQEVTATPDAWYEAKEAIAEARQIILHKLNLVAWLSDYIENFA